MLYGLHLIQAWLPGKWEAFPKIAFLFSVFCFLFSGDFLTVSLSQSRLWPLLPIFGTPPFFSVLGTAPSGKWGGD